MIESLETLHPALPATAGLIVLLAVAFAAHFITRFLLARVVRAFARRSNSTWDDALAEEKVFGRIAQIVPALILYNGIRFVPGVAAAPESLILNVAMAYMVLMAALAVSATLSAANRIYSVHPAARQKPIKGFIQLAQIVVFIVGGVLIVATLIDRSPAILLGGLGAMTAVLLLIFRDTILGLVASVQLTAQDMVRVGDWIEMPRFGADGDVIDVALHTVKVQNWDKTITTIPTHALISDSFKNWRGMSASGGRRIMRSVFIDVESIRFLTSDEIARFRRFALLRKYIDDKEAELEEYNAHLDEERKDLVNLRRLTNIGTFRAYVYNYVKNHPGIHKEMTLMVRQLAPGADGLPLEIYAFTNTTAWAGYEGIQADIFDHVFAITKEFGLHLFQNPTGQDIRRAFPAAESKA